MSRLFGDSPELLFQWRIARVNPDPELWKVCNSVRKDGIVAMQKYKLSWGQAKEPYQVLDSVFIFKSVGWQEAK